MLLEANSISNKIAKFIEQRERINCINIFFSETPSQIERSKYGIFLCKRYNRINRCIYFRSFRFRIMGTR